MGRVPRSTGRVWTLAGVLAACVAGVLAYAVLVPTSVPREGPAPDVPSVPTLSSPPARPFMLVRSLISDDSHGRLGLSPLAAPDGPRYIGGPRCERVHFSAGRGVCLTISVEGIAAKYAAEIFDERFETTGRLPLTGLPSRVRVSPDGRRAGITVFEQGHSYAQSGFSTRTTIVDTTTAEVLGDLEAFAVVRGGQPFRKVDFNFWGVTFARDSNRFYATLATEGVKYLVEGDVDARAARVIGTGVECPSLSPDNTRVAYKKAFTGPLGLGWHLHVLDLATLRDTALAMETRSVDDQVEWLDDGHVIYHLSASHGADIWVLAADGQTPPRVLVPMAYSPAVVR